MVISTTTTSLAPTGNNAPQKAASGGARDVDLATDECAEPVVGSFDALLSATRVLVGAGPAGRPHALASQMFEAQSDNAHQGRQETLKEAHRAEGLSGQRDERTDVASVRARRAARESRSDGTTSRSPATFAGSTDMRADGPGAKVSSGGGDSVPTLRELLGRGADGGNMADRGDARAVSRDGAGVQVSDALRAVAPPGHGADTDPAASRASTGASAVLSGTQVKPGASSNTGVAQRIGQILGAGRGGEVESARAPTSPPAPQQSRQSPQQQRGVSEQAQQNRPGSGATAGRSEEPDAVSRSAFDRLVRSVRLGTGRYSSTARMHLEPPELGRMLVNVRMVGDELQIEIRTETTEAKDLLLERVARLRTALERHGIHVGRFDVASDLVEQRNHPETPLNPDGFQPAGGEERGHRRPEPARHETRETSHDVDAPGEQDDVLESMVVGERRLDVRI